FRITNLIAQFLSLLSSGGPARLRFIRSLFHSCPGSKIGHHGTEKSNLSRKKGADRAEVRCRLVSPSSRKCYVCRQTAGQELGVHSMSKISVLSAVLGLLATAAMLPAVSAEGAKDAIPNFNPDGETGWAAGRPASDDFLPHDRSAGPGPVESDPAHPYTPNGQGQPTYRIADLTNPILQPWVVAQMKKTND